MDSHKGYTFGYFYQSSSRKEQNGYSLSMEGRCLDILGIIGNEQTVLGCDGCRIGLAVALIILSLKVLAQQFFLILTKQ